MKIISIKEQFNKNTGSSRRAAIFAGRIFSSRGVTLSELLVAISIAGVVMMAAYAIFSSSIRQFTDGINQLEAQRNGRRIISFMRKKLSSAVSGLKASDIGEKAPTGLSTGIELCVIPEDGVTKLNDSDLFYKAVTETYYLSEGRIMFKDDNNHQPRKVFDSVKSIYFKIFTLKRGPSSVPAVLVTVNTFCGNQSASYESMVTPVFIGGLKSAESMILPLVNSYALESAN